MPARRVRARLSFAVLFGTALVVPAALASHDVPTKANKLVVTFVRAMQQCTGPFPHTHDAPLAFPACNPVSASPTLSFGPAGRGQATFAVKLNPAHQAVDVKVSVKLLDVRTGDDGTGAPFSGNLLMVAIGRITDHGCDGSGTPCTIEDVPVSVDVPCNDGTCVTRTTLNAVVTGVIVPGAQASYGLGQLAIYTGSDRAFEGGLLMP